MPDTPLDKTTDAAGGGIPRRTLIRGMAWSVPVIAVAVGAPAASASIRGILEFESFSREGGGIQPGEQWKLSMRLDLRQTIGPMPTTDSVSITIDVPLDHLGAGTILTADWVLTQSANSLTVMRAALPAGKTTIEVQFTRPPSTPSTDVTLTAVMTTTDSSITLQNVIRTQVINYTGNVPGFEE